MIPQKLNFTPRYDLRRSAVAIRYERSRTVNGAEGLDIHDDVFPTSATGLEVDALCYTINLIGSQASSISAEVEVAEVDFSSLGWWLELLPELRDPTIVSCEFSIGAEYQATGEGALDYYVIPGTGGIADWMEIDVAEVRFEAWFDITRRGAAWPAAIQPEVKRRVHKSVTLITTDFEGGTLTTGGGFQGEPFPVGIAEIQYNALSQLQHDGGFELQEEECSGVVKMGDAVTVNGTVLSAAQVQAVIEDIDKGKTVVRVGPTQTLSVNDLVELLR